MNPPSKQDLQLCALIGVKVTENLPLTDDEKEKLLPSMRSWDSFTLQEFMCWESDKFRLFGNDPVFHEFRLIEDGSSLTIQPLFYSPDPDTTYCIVTNGSDSGVLMVHEHDNWYIMACVGVYNIMKRLEETGFLPWQQFLEHKPTTTTTTTTNEAYSDDDYWNQYDNEQEEEEKGSNQPTKKADTKLYVRSHCQKSVRDLWNLYKTGGAIEQFANDLLCVTPNYRGSVGNSSPMSQYTQKVAQNELQLYEQVDLDLGLFISDIELVLLELDFSVLARLK